MNALAFQVLTLLVGAGPVAATENTLLTELVEKGVVMPDGQVVPLAPPAMAEGLNAAQQEAVLAAVAPPRVKVEDFLDKASNAPISLKVKKILAKNGNDIIRTVNLHFIVYGDWEMLTSDQFSKSILKEGKAKNGNAGGMVSKAGYLKDMDLAVRGLQARQTPNLREYFLYTTFNLFDEVDLSSTRYGLATKMPDGVIVAAKLDSRFAKDKEYPNRWRKITRDSAANIEYGPPNPYSGAGFYAKVTRLIKPQDAIFVEFHQVFYEPQEWFDQNVNRVPNELKKIIPFEVKQFRIRLANATAEQAEKKAGGEKPTEK